MLFSKVNARASTARASACIRTESHQTQRCNSSSHFPQTLRTTSLQFIAEHSLRKDSPPGFPELFQTTLGFFRESLQAIHRNGEITLPLGLRATSETHQRLESGTVFLMIADKTIDAKQATSTLLDAFALTAGLTGAAKKRRLPQA